MTWTQSIWPYEGHNATKLSAVVLTQGNANLQSGGRSLLLYLPGLGGTTYKVLPFLESLSHSFDCIVGLDLRGFGLNHTTPLEHIRQIEQDLIAFIETHRLADRFDSVHIAGISLGGVLATLLAHRFQSTFRSLLLLAPAFQPHSNRFPAHFVARQLLRLLSGEQTMQLPYALQDITRNETVLAEAGEGASQPLTVSLPFMMSIRLFAMKATRLARDINLPMMLVQPNHDTVCSAKAMQRVFEQWSKTAPTRQWILPSGSA